MGYNWFFFKTYFKDLPFGANPLQSISYKEDKNWPKGLASMLLEPL